MGEASRAGSVDCAGAEPAELLAWVGNGGAVRGVGLAGAMAERGAMEGPEMMEGLWVMERPWVMEGSWVMEEPWVMEGLG